MSEIEQLKERIINSNYEGVPTAYIRDDYEPAGQMMIQQLTGDGFSQAKVPSGGFNEYEWRIFADQFRPY